MLLPVLVLFRHTLPFKGTRALQVPGGILAEGVHVALSAA